jgi:hypothetical protein
VQAAGVRTLVVHRAPTGLGIEKLAVAAGTPTQSEDAVFEIEMLNQTRFTQALGNLFGLFMLGFKRVDQLEAHQVGHLHLYRHGAAVRGTAVAQAIAVAGPGFWAVDVDQEDGRFHDDGSKAWSVINARSARRCRERSTVLDGKEHRLRTPRDLAHDFLSDHINFDQAIVPDEVMHGVLSQADINRQNLHPTWRKACLFL